MDLALYRGPSGVYIVVPDCLQPSLTAENRHGPLRFGMKFPVVDGATDSLRSRLARDFDSQAYAVVTADEASALIEGLVRP